MGATRVSTALPSGGRGRCTAGMRRACTRGCVPSRCDDAHRGEVTAVAAVQQSSHHAVAQAMALRGRHCCHARRHRATKRFGHIVRLEVIRKYVVLALTSSCRQARLLGVGGHVPAQVVPLAALFSPIEAMAAARFNRAGMCEQTMGAAPVAANQPQICTQSARACLRVCDANARQGGVCAFHQGLEQPGRASAHADANHTADPVRPGCRACTANVRDCVHSTAGAAPRRRTCWSRAGSCCWCPWVTQPCCSGWRGGATAARCIRSGRGCGRRSTAWRWRCIARRGPSMARSARRCAMASATCRSIWARCCCCCSAGASLSAWR